MCIRKYVATFLVTLLFFAAFVFTPPSRVSAQDSNELLNLLPANYLVKYKGSNKLTKSWKKLKITEKNQYRSLITNPDIIAVQPEVTYSIQLTPNDPYYAAQDPFFSGQFNQWNMRKIGLNPVITPSSGLSGWEISTGSANTIIAMVDSGIDLTHPEFTGKLWVNPDEIAANGIDDDNNGYVDDINGWNFFNDNNSLQDELMSGGNPLSHGTYTSGIAAANSDNAAGIAGVCWGCKIMVLKVFGEENLSSDFYTALAIDYAVEKGANIINLSLGGLGYSVVTQEAVNNAVANGVVVVAASGNATSDSSAYSPAGLRNVITVNATNVNDNFSSSFSNFGSRTDLTAPGQSVLTTRRNSTPSGCVGAVRYACLSGTSMSAPHVSGVAALLYDLHKDDPTPWDFYDIRKVLLSTAEDKGTSGFDTLYGYGRVNALNALSVTNPNLGVGTPTASLNTPANNVFATHVTLSGSVNSTNLYAYYLSFISHEYEIPLYMYTGRGNKTNATLMNFDIPATLYQYEGAYTVTLVAEDFNGNTSDEDDIEIIIDTTPPTTFNLTGPTTNWINNGTPTLTWQESTDANGPVKYDIFINDVLTYTDISTNSYTPSSPISNGSKQWKVRAKDAAGNTRTTSNRNIKIDTQIPNNFTIGKTSLSDKAVLSFSTTDNVSGISHYQISINNGSFSTATSPYTTAVLGNGTHSAKVRAFDVAGNFREVSTTFVIDSHVYFLKTKGDFNADGTVNLSDLSILATYWNQNSSIADANNDGVVNISDLSILAINWQQSF